MLCDKGLSQQIALKKQFKWNYTANWKRGLNNLSFLNFRPTSLVNCGADITKELRIPHAVYPSVKWTRLLCGFDGSVRLNWSVLSTLSISVCFCLCKKKILEKSQLSCWSFVRAAYTFITFSIPLKLVGIRCTATWWIKLPFAMSYRPVFCLVNIFNYCMTGSTHGQDEADLVF